MNKSFFFFRLIDLHWFISCKPIFLRFIDFDLIPKSIWKINENFWLKENEIAHKITCLHDFGHQTSYLITQSHPLPSTNFSITIYPNNLWPFHMISGVFLLYRHSIHILGFYIEINFWNMWLFFIIKIFVYRVLRADTRFFLYSCQFSEFHDSKHLQFAIEDFLDFSNFAIRQ